MPGFQTELLCDFREICAWISPFPLWKGLPF